MGIRVWNLVHKHGLCDNTIYRRKAKYGGMEVSGWLGLRSFLPIALGGSTKEIAIKQISSSCVTD